MPTVLRVAVPVPLPQLFDYLLPVGVDVAALIPGCRVLVPFGRTQRVGVLLEIAHESNVPSHRLKPALMLLDAQPLLNAELLRSLIWAARYYQHPLGAVLECALPVGLRQAKPLPADGERALALTEMGSSASPTGKPAARTNQLLQMLAQGPRTYLDLDDALPGWRAAATSLRKRGLIVGMTLTTRARPHMPLVGPPLNVEQQRAVDEIGAAHGRFAPFVLEGVTGSGKTEVYLALIEQALARGQQALVLVPEIGLTPQILRRFRERLPCPVHALHSGLSDGERTRTWLAAARGDAQVILGTRSAIFTPLPRAGLIVVDEEHDASYKQQEGFRYHARDLALVRARSLNVPVVLGSATPSLETLANVETGRYRCLPLRERAGAARMPTPRIVDLRGQRLQHGLSTELIHAIRACLGRGEQALVFKNRRGYAPVLLCHGCGWTATCIRCNKPLTLHRRENRLRCHHCGADKPVPIDCPECHGSQLQTQGQGTEKLEEMLIEIFPHVPVVRIDRETTRRKDALEQLFAQLTPDQPGILVGTQMLAKGHDLPNLTLVAIVGVDEGLFSHDFRAGERMGQLVVQVAGRAGRARKPGTVWLQTHHPEHPLLVTLLRRGYRELAAQILDERRGAGFPPHTHLALLRADASSLAPLQEFLDRATTLASSADENLQALGPMPAPMPRRAGRERAQLLLLADQRSTLQGFLPQWLEQLRTLPEAKRVRWSLDVDPVDLY